MDKVGKKSVKVEKKNKAKSKQKEKKPKKKNQIVVAARARLEPRLSLSSENKSSEKNKKKVETETSIEKDKKLMVLLDTNEVEGYLKSCNLKAGSKLKSPATIKNSNLRRETSDSDNVSSLENQDCGTSLKNIDTNFGDDEDFQKFISQSKKRVTKGLYWTDKEIKDLAYALQYHGFANIKEVAAHIKTKTENDVRVFVKSRIDDRRKAKTSDIEPDRQRGRPPSAWSTVVPEVLETWPNVRKWKRLAYEQMLCYTRNKDYSKPVISALCEKFYEEEPEPEDPQLINVKLIYKYISDCMSGNIPPQLPPKESALVLDLLREARLMPIAYDFEEERQFLKDFKHATTFKPFEVKDEFKKKLKKVPEEINDPNTVSVPEEVFLELSRHKRLLQSFNPLITPVWMVQKEQEHLEKYFEESNVYVD